MSWQRDLRYKGRPCLIDRGRYCDYYPTGAPKGADDSIDRGIHPLEWHQKLWFESRVARLGYARAHSAKRRF